MHSKKDNQYFAYAPYVREMNLWLKHVHEIEIIAPLTNYTKTEIDEFYNHSKINLSKIPEIEFTSVVNSIKSILKIPYIVFKIYKACVKTDHIHLRCPGNIGLIGCFVQIFFPYKIKTAKYAGNWDPNSKQPLSYRIQKNILRNTFLTKNMQVLVYGGWKNQTTNIKPFFTATYHDHEKEELIERNYDFLNFIFVGSLVPGKRPLMTIKIIEYLLKNNIECNLDVYGEGILKQDLLDYISANRLESNIKIHGNVTKDELKMALKKSHFLLLPSRSEGWPKAVSEAMFFGVIPITTDVSCLRWMLDEGRRGVLINEELNSATQKIIESITNGNLVSMSVASQFWSQNYTLEKFENEIQKLLNQE
jgi:glycosyltransferase involved in cell wall biosynthesis